MTTPTDAEIETLARVVLLAEAAKTRQAKQRLARALPVQHVPNRKGRRAAKSKRAT